MSYLPQHTSDEAGTKIDLVRLRARVDERFDRFEAHFEDRFELLAERMDRMQRFCVGTTVVSMTALTAVFTLAVSFLI
jgi:hypothetical protein